MVFLLTFSGVSPIFKMPLLMIVAMVVSPKGECHVDPEQRNYDFERPWFPPGAFVSNPTKLVLSLF